MNKLRRILVVDGSRVVRATLAKHLKDDFDIREETNGELAWHTLVLDASIVAVISGAHTAKLEAHELVRQIRANPLRRLRELPFLVIVSDIDKHGERERDSACGVSGFITKTMKKSEIVEHLHALLALRTTSPSSGPAASAAHASPPVQLLSCHEIEARTAQALASDEQRRDGVCALMFGIDKRDELTAQFGEELAEEIGARFAGLLLAKIGPCDSIGRQSGERMLIVSRGVDLAHCARFAGRVCGSLASGLIAVRGQPVKLTASAGVASAVEDGIGDSDELLALASQRLEQAQRCGGNNVVTADPPDCAPQRTDLQLASLLEALNARGRKAILSQIGALGLQILPLLKMMDHELALGLPLSEIKRQLQLRARLESDAI